MRWILIIALSAGPCLGQSIRLDAGTSTMGALGSGGSVTSYFPSNTLVLSGGVQGGHVIAGASDSFALRGGQITLGSQQLSAAVEGAGISMPGLGVSYTRRDATADNIAGIFAGSVGTGFSLPWMSSVTPQHVGFAAFAQRRIRDNFKVGFVSAISGGERTALGSLGWKSSSLSANAVAGRLNGQVFSSATAMYRRQDFTVTAAHYDTFTPIRARSDSIGGGFYSGWLSLGGSVSQSATGRGSMLAENLMASVRYSRIENTVGIYHSRGLLLTDMVDERVTRHLTLSQTVSRSEGSTNLSGGFEYASNRFSCGVTQGVALVPGAGYVRTESAHITLSIHGTRMSATLLTAPGIRPQYSTTAEKWAQGPLTPETKTRSPKRASGKYAVRGVVHSESGEPLSGVAVFVGETLTFSNRSGTFETRAKSDAPVTVRVDIDQSVVIGDWRVKDCPETVRPAVDATAVNIILFHP